MEQPIPFQNVIPTHFSHFARFPKEEWLLGVHWWKRTKELSFWKLRGVRLRHQAKCCLAIRILQKKQQKLERNDFGLQLCYNWALGEVNLQFTVPVLKPAFALSELILWRNMKPQKSHRFLDDFRRNKSELIR